MCTGAVRSRRSQPVAVTARFLANALISKGYRAGTSRSLHVSGHRLLPGGSVIEGASYRARRRWCQTWEYPMAMRSELEVFFRRRHLRYNAKVLPDHTKCGMVPLTRIERATEGVGTRCSIQLSCEGPVGMMPEGVRIVQTERPRYFRSAWSRSQLFSASMRWPDVASLGILDKHACKVSSTAPEAAEPPPPAPDDEGPPPPSVAHAPMKRTKMDERIHAPSRRVVIGVSL